VASFENFKKNKKSVKNMSLFEKPVNRQKTKPRSVRLEEGIDEWTSFYRANPHRFVEDFLGIKLKIFQQILLYIMMHFNFLTYIAARGQGKTYLTAIFCITISILKPNSKVVAVSGQKSQARETLGKIKEIMNDSPLLEREIKDFRDGTNEPRVDFHNGSYIRVLAASEGSRGARSTVLIVDEYRQVSTEIVDSVLRKFQISPRNVKFMEKPEYKGDKKYQERNKQIFLSSAWYKAHESWDRVVTYNDNMTDGQNYFGCSIPYQVSIKEGLLMEEEVQDEMSERTFNEVKFQMEMEAMFWGENLNSYFKYEEIQKNRTLLKVYYPQETRELLNEKTLKLPKKENGEIRVISADIAMMGGAQNDASVFTVARCIPINGGYERQLMYIESLEGGHTNIQSNRIRQLFSDFDCDYLVLDTQNAGVSVYDQLTLHSVDPQRGTEYEPWSCMNDEELAKRCVYPNSPKVVYSIKGSASLNSKIAAIFKDTLRKGQFKLPIHEDETKDVLEKLSGYKTLDKEYQLQLKLPYIQTTIMATEILNLEDDNSGKSDTIRIKESRSARKDKYSSISYLNYFVSDVLEIKNRRNTKTDINPADLFMVRQSSTRHNRSRGGGFF